MLLYGYIRRRYFENQMLAGQIVAALGTVLSTATETRKPQAAPKGKQGSTQQRKQRPPPGKAPGPPESLGVFLREQGIDMD